MPKLIRLYIRHSALGFGVAALFVGLLLWLDAAHLRHLIFGAGGINLLGLLILYLSHAFIFAGVQFAYAVMSLAEPEAPRGGGKAEQLRPCLQSITLPKRNGS